MEVDEQMSLFEAPYADGTGGWMAEGSSRERAEREADDGTLSRRRAQVYALVEKAGERGITCHEVDDLLDTNHGQSSGVLSGLHRTGHITRLAGKEYQRLASEPYVTPENVAGREVRTQGWAKKPCPECGGEV